MMSKVQLKSFGELFKAPFIDEYQNYEHNENLYSLHNYYDINLDKIDDMFFDLNYDDIVFEESSSENEDEDDHIILDNKKKLFEQFTFDSKLKFSDHVSEMSYQTDDSQFYDSFFGSNYGSDASIYDDEVDLCNTDDKSFSNNIALTNIKCLLSEYSYGLETINDEGIEGFFSSSKKKVKKQIKNIEKQNDLKDRYSENYVNYIYRPSIRLMFCNLNRNSNLFGATYTSVGEKIYKKKYFGFVTLEDDAFECNDKHTKIVSKYHSMDDCIMNMEISEDSLFDSYFGFGNYLPGCLHADPSSDIHSLSHSNYLSFLSDADNFVLNRELNSDWGTDWVELEKIYPKIEFELDGSFLPNYQSTQFKQRIIKSVNNKKEASIHYNNDEKDDTNRSSVEKEGGIQWWTYVRFGVAIAAVGIALVYFMKKYKGDAEIMTKRNL